MHGHVVPRPDGAKARCGGPALCAQCAREKAQHDLLADAVILERAIQVLERLQPSDSEAKAATIAWLRYNANVVRMTADA